MRYRLAFVLFALLSGSAAAGSIQGVCDARFVGSSTLHDFSGTVRSRPFNATFSGQGAGDTVLPSVVVEFPVADMRTGIDARDEKMREMFQSDRFPVIRAEARDVDAGKVRDRLRKDSSGKTPLEVGLAIRGVERKIQASAGNWKEEGGRIAFDIEFPVSLSEFGLKPPSVLGIIRVADRIAVKGSVTFTVQDVP